VDASGRISALQTRVPDLSDSAADQAIGTLLHSAENRDWWFSGSHLYQVVVRPYYQDPTHNSSPLGKVVVGREIDATKAKDLARILSSEVLFQQPANGAISSFLPFQEQELSRQIHSGAASQEVHLGKQRFFASSLELDPAGLRFVVLESGDEALAALARLNRLLFALGLVAVLAGGVLIYVISDTFT